MANIGLTASVYIFIFCIAILLCVCACQCCCGVSPEKALNPFFWGENPPFDCWGWWCPWNDPLPRDKVEVKGLKKETVEAVVLSPTREEEVPLQPVYAEPAAVVARDEFPDEEKGLPVLLLPQASYTRHSRTGFTNNTRYSREFKGAANR
jgi:hypothetical protein